MKENCTVYDLSLHCSVSALSTARLIALTAPSTSSLVLTPGISCPPSWIKTLLISSSQSEFNTSLVPGHSRSFRPQIFAVGKASKTPSVSRLANRTLSFPPSSSPKISGIPPEKKTVHWKGGGEVGRSLACSIKNVATKAAPCE
jgi:hypothetical protein